MILKSVAFPDYKSYAYYINEYIKQRGTKNSNFKKRLIGADFV